MIQIAYGQSAVVSGWIVAPMAITAMFGKSAVIKILESFLVTENIDVQYFSYWHTHLFNGNPRN